LSKVEERLQALGFALPQPPRPAAAYVPAVRTGSLVFVSGQGPVRDGQAVYTGKVGAERTEEEGYKAAQIAILNALAVLKAEIGNLDKVTRIVKLVGWVNSAPGFTRQPWVVNGASELLQQVFGDKGLHARSAVSAHELPLDWTVEIEMVAEVEP